MRETHFWMGQVRKEVRSMPTNKLIKEYHWMNAEGRKAARDELKERKIAAKNLPYKKSQRRASSSFGGFSLGKPSKRQSWF